MLVGVAVDDAGEIPCSRALALSWEPWGRACAAAAGPMWTDVD